MFKLIWAANSILSMKTFFFISLWLICIPLKTKMCDSIIKAILLFLKHFFAQIHQFFYIFKLYKLSSNQFRKKSIKTRRNTFDFISVPSYCTWKFILKNQIKENLFVFTFSALNQDFQTCEAKSKPCETEALATLQNKKVLFRWRNTFNLFRKTLFEILICTFLDFKLKSFSCNMIFWELKAFIVLSLGDEKDQGTCSSSRWLKLDCLKLFCISDVTQFLWHCFFSQNNISSNDVW